MKRTIITIAVVLAALAGGAFILKNNKDEMQTKTELAKKVNTTVPVQITKARKDTLVGSFTASGNFEPARQIKVVSEATGKVIQLAADEGQFVRKGQLLARVEYATLEAELASAKAQLEKLETDRTRFQNLLKTGGVTQSQAEEVNLNFVNAEARYVAAKKRLADTYIKAPFAGYINKRYIEPGSYLTSGKEVFEIVDLSTLKMVVNVTESQVLAVGQAKDIVVSADVYPGAKYTAKVNFIGAQADANLNFPVELEITNINNKPLRGGMYGRAFFKLPSSTPSLVIPREALLGSVDQAQVFVVRDSAAVLQPLLIGRVFSNQLEVLEGLEEGDVIVTSGQINLSNGTTVAVINN